MAIAPKPITADGYDADHTLACERVLVTMLAAFGTLKTTLRLVGGLVPRYLTPEAPPDVPAHFGTSDVDVVLNLQVIAEGDGYDSLADQLKARKFERYTNPEGKVSKWRWLRQVSEHEYVMVEFLQGATEQTPAGRVAGVDGEAVSALAINHADIVHDWYREKEVTVELLDEGGISTETVRFADVPAFVILKALAFDDRGAPKDAGDLIHVLRYAGTPEELARQILDRISTGKHAQAIEDGLRALERRFCDGEGVEGYLRNGPVAFATFLLGTDPELEEERILEQRNAAGLVNEIVVFVRRQRIAPEATA